MRYIISAGGTGGHIYPALSIINKIKEEDKDAKILYIGTTDRMEKDIVPNLGIDYLGIKMNGLGKSVKKICGFLVNTFTGLNKCKKVMKKFKEFFKKLNIIQIVLYVILMGIDIYILGSIDFIEHKLYGVLFVVLNTCLITFIKSGGKNNK